MKTKIYNINNLDYGAIAKMLNKNKIGIFPTETVYGIIAKATSTKALKRIYKVKKRDENKALIVLIASLSMLDDIGLKVSPKEQELMTKFWPGALTIILDIKDSFSLSPLVLGGNKTLAVRYTSKEILQKVIALANTPVVAPSANFQGEKAGTNPKDLLSSFAGQVDFLVDEGIISRDIPSTLVRVEKDKVKVLREGIITKDMLKKEGFTLV